jgi:metallo-beta-lactamase class B
VHHPDSFQHTMKTGILLFVFLFLFGQSNAQQAEGRMIISQLQANFYIVTTFKPIDGKPFPSNSMYVVTDGGVLLIDTPWNENEVLPLLDSIWKRHGQKVVLCVVTHAHADKTAGLDILKKIGIPTYSSLQTHAFALEKSEKQAAFCFLKDTTFQIGHLILQTYYPGEGHTKDNLVIWFPAQKVLYGGCLVKSVEANSLGNIADANLDAWPVTIKNLARKFPDAAYIIPGHQDWHSTDALTHTLKLLKESKSSTK